MDIGKYFSLKRMVSQYRKTTAEKHDEDPGFALGVGAPEVTIGFSEDQLNQIRELDERKKRLIRYL